MSDEHGTDNVEQKLVRLVEGRRIRLSPEPQVTYVSPASVSKEIYPVMETVTREKILIKLAIFKLPSVDDIVDDSCPVVFGHDRGDGITELEIALVSLEIVGVHVDRDGVVVAGNRASPLEGGEKIGVQQIGDRARQCFADVLLIEAGCNDIDDRAELASLVGVEEHA
ncbi:MAG TPA: hypothetical protein VHU90_13750 [Galbitalea sp.]|nr:hypothetical protein [Galbitalea sp.]